MWQTHINTLETRVQFPAGETMSNLLPFFLAAKHMHLFIRSFIPQ